MRFLGRKLGALYDPFIAVEISGNHRGSIERAFSLMRAAKESGAHAVKIQCYESDEMTIPNEYLIKGDNLWKGRDLYKLYKDNCTPYDWIPRLFEYAKSINFPIFSSVYSEKGLEILEKVNCPAYKIASFEANDPYFIEKVAKTGKPLVISTGMMSNTEIDRAVSHALINEENNIILLHCISKYPTQLKDTNLSGIRKLQGSYVLPIGYSCHCPHGWALILAALEGASMIEIHMCLGDEVDTECDDYEFSVAPRLLKTMLSHLSEIRKALDWNALPDNGDSIQFRRSLYVVKDINEGEVFTAEHIKSYRPALGCAPYLLGNIVGYKANREIKANTPMSMEYVK